MATMHNHPGSSIPSVEDILSLKVSGAQFDVIVAHDGTIYTYKLVKRPAPGYKLTQKQLSGVHARRADDEVGAFEAIEQLLGVRIEHLTPRRRGAGRG